MIIKTVKDKHEWLDLWAKLEVELIIHDQMLDEAWTEHRTWTITDTGRARTTTS